MYVCFIEEKKPGNNLEDVRIDKLSNLFFYAVLFNDLHTSVESHCILLVPKTVCLMSNVVLANVISSCKENCNGFIGSSAFPLKIRKEMATKHLQQTINTDSTQTCRKK